MGSIDYFRAARPDTGHIRKLIENSLLFDWAITIEYADGNSETAFWQQWDDSFFALNSAEPVIVALTDCYNKNPGYAIRLIAVKFRPQIRMVHMVYKPTLLPASANKKVASFTKPYPSIEDSASTSSNTGLPI